ncbi:MAG: 50S ribosomal protein L1 [Euryarchaeota archaeon]|nr:50S ribosomal protein L1 [Euryarchaeota archaeon]
MAITTEGVLKAVEGMKTSSPKRKFRQSVDLALTLKELDMSKPENRINEELVLPNGRGKEIKVGVIADGELALQAKKVADTVIMREELEELAKDKKAAKKLANGHDFFVAQSDMMSMIGKTLGPVLGPRGKMPKPVPANVQIAPVVERLKKTVRVKTKEKPTIHIVVGMEDMEEKQLAENIETVLRFIERKLERGMENVRSVYIKTTMGPGARLEV